MIRDSRALVIALTLTIAACGTSSVVTVATGPSDTVRAAFQRLAAHDLAGLSSLTCPGQRDPLTSLTFVSGLFSPVGSVPTGSVAETLALIDYDISGIRVGEVATDNGSVLVPVSGTLRLRLDPAEVEIAVRAAYAAQNEVADEAALEMVLTAIKAGPATLDLAQEAGAIPVTRIDGAWLICQPLPSMAPEAPTWTP